MIGILIVGILNGSHEIDVAITTIKKTQKIKKSTAIIIMEDRQQNILFRNFGYTIS